MNNTNEDCKKIECKLISEVGEIEAVLEAISNEPFMEMYRNVEFRLQHAEKLSKHACVIVEYHDDVPMAVLAFYANDLEKGIIYITVLAVKPSLGLQKFMTVQRIARVSLTIPTLKQMQYVRLSVNEANYYARKLYEQVGFSYTGERIESNLYMEIKYEDILGLANIITSGKLQSKSK